ncbi:MAG TPA: glycosyltransferase family 39 protein, partial [Acidobacteriaceae bacterium]|nr:glycosyltransferase family 39 protein [Acidobacteriaceae bacterium]
MSHSAVDTKDAKGLPLSAVGFLVLTAAISLAVSHYRMMWFDEFLILNTDSVSSLRQLLHVQRTTPISLDPFTYHLFAHLSIRLFGAGAFAIRLPSLLGYLLMQVCLFLFVRRIASQNAALFAMVFPSLLYAQYFSVAARPYGLELGLYALVMLCWQNAIRSDSHRTATLITLAVALSLKLNTHFFAILLLIPLYAAELFRSVQRRRLDLPLLASIGLGTAAIVAALPFVKAAAEFREHYIALNVDAHFIPLAYQTLLVFPDGSSGMGRTIFLAVLILALLWGGIRLVKYPVPGMLKPEYVLLITLTALPFFGYLLAVFVTHSIYARYVIGAALGMTILEAVAFAPLLNSRRTFRVVLGLMLLVVLAHGVQRIHRERQSKQRRLAELVLSPVIKAELMSTPDHLLYIQDLETFFVARFYEPDPDVRARLALVCSYDQELRLMNQDTYWMQGTHLGDFTDARVVSYETIASQPGEHL